MRSLMQLIAADNITQKENAKFEAQIAIARAMIRAGRLSRSALGMTASPPISVSFLDERRSRLKAKAPKAKLFQN